MRKKSSGRTMLVAATVTVILLVVALFFLFNNGKEPQIPSSTVDNKNSDNQLSVALPNPRPANEPYVQQPTPPQIKNPANPKTEALEIENIVTPMTESAQTKEQLKKVATAINNLNNFFTYLDQQEYVIALNLPNNTKVTFSNLVQKLVDDPPVISGESDDLFTLLKNTAHFFRIMGGDNISLLKEIFIREGKKIENLAADLYVVLNHQEKLKEFYNIELQENTLYEYSSFLMNTMGGRLYMFRRDLELRMIVSYYSLLFVEQAELDGLNRHGIDILPFVTALVNEIENHGQRLLNRDIYLNNLYSIEERLNQ